MSEVEQRDGGAGRRQRRWLDMHDRLYEAACELFLESDFVSTSVDDIAERADVARKTAFNHFPRKRDFVSEWGRRRRQEVDEVLSQGLMQTASFEKVLRHYFGVMADLYEQRRPLAIRMMKGWRESGGPFDADPHLLVGVFREMVVRASSQGELRPDVTADRVPIMLYSCYFGTLFDWVEGPDDKPPFDLKAAFSDVLDVVLRGLIADA